VVVDATKAKAAVWLWQLVVEILPSTTKAIMERSRKTTAVACIIILMKLRFVHSKNRDTGGARCVDVALVMLR
jgi:ribose 5-phosphate isomerase